MMRSLLALAPWLLPQAAQSLLWFNDAPNNLGDFDGLTTKAGVFYLRYNNGSTALEIYPDFLGCFLTKHPVPADCWSGAEMCLLLQCLARCALRYWPSLHRRGHQHRHASNRQHLAHEPNPTDCRSRTDALHHFCGHSSTGF